MSYAQGEADPLLILETAVSLWGEHYEKLATPEGNARFGTETAQIRTACQRGDTARATELAHRWYRTFLFLYETTEHTEDAPFSLRMRDNFKAIEEAMRN